MTTDESFGKQSYDNFADRYADQVETKLHNAHIVKPSVMPLLPPLAGLRILDAGCGSGHYSEEFIEAGAEVVAVDETPRFVEITAERLGDRARVLQHDLTQPLTFAQDDSFDLVFAVLVLDYNADWTPILAEFHRVLRPGGALVVCCHHPLDDWQGVLDGDYMLLDGAEANYFAVQPYECYWRGFGDPPVLMKFYRRPLESTFAALLGGGFTLDQLAEAKPDAQFKQLDPAGYAKYGRRPTFLCFRGRKR